MWGDYMKNIENIIKKLDKVFELASVIILSIMVLSITLQVVFRILDKPLAWSVELSQYLFVWLTFIAGYVGARRGQHIGVEYFHTRTPKPIGNFLKFISNLLPAVYFGVIFYFCVSLWPKLMAQRTAMLKVPMAMVYLGMMIGLFMLAIYYLYLALNVYLAKENMEEV
jgi:TRAP-type C4-dicarboxylate transport system permease small subunit